MSGNAQGLVGAFSLTVLTLVLTEQFAQLPAVVVAFAAAALVLSAGHAD